MTAGRSRKEGKEMTGRAYIYTEANDCQDCYKCIRECPVKAIRMENHSASVIQENCIYCGHCTSACPVGAKQVREDVSRVKYLIEGDDPVIVSLAPSYISEFPEYTPGEFAGMLVSLGFSSVSETALGAEMVSAAIRESQLLRTPGIHISPCCPSVLDLIHKYHPEHAHKIIELDTPMLAHGKYLKSLYGENARVVFIGPCIAKKKEADLNPGIIDAVITFKRLRRWMEEEGILHGENAGIRSAEFVPYTATDGKLYPVERGMIGGIKGSNENEDIAYLSYSGTEKILPILSNLEDLEGDSPVFLELMSCAGGCVNGPGTTKNHSLAGKELQVVNYWRRQGVGHGGFSIPQISLVNQHDGYEHLQISRPGESEINEILLSIGKKHKEDEFNCGGCGYENCRDFAMAVFSGKAESTMCISYMRRLAQDKATVLLQRMPYGVVIVNRKMQIVESNRNFAELLGEEVLRQHDADPGLEGYDLRELVPFHLYFSAIFSSGDAYFEKDIRFRDQFLHLSVFALEGKNMICAMLHNLRAPELNRAEMVKRTRKVIRENLETVQKIAFYLGENASNMETLLNSMVDIQKEDYDE